MVRYDREIPHNFTYFNFTYYIYYKCTKLYEVFNNQQELLSSHHFWMNLDDYVYVTGPKSIPLLFWLNKLANEQN